jgi:hypothetical protein
VVDERERRVGLNEVLFRQVNERLKEVGESFSLVTETAEFVCECGDLSCTDPITMTLAEYERIRSDSTQFVIKQGHEVADVERVVEEHEQYQVVAKRAGTASRLAVAEDDRRP